MPREGQVVSDRGQPLVVGATYYSFTVFLKELEMCQCDTDEEV